MRRDYDRRKDELQKSRNYYAKAAQSERLQLQSDILKAEQDLDSLELSIRQLEKEIRYTETQYLND